MKRLRVSATLVLAATSLVISAEDVPARASYDAVRAAASPVIDGDLADSAWESAPELTGFVQRDPEEGKPATRQTRVKVVYDEEAIYFGAVMEDDAPATPLLARRDAELNDGDYIRISIDSQHDRMNGAAFVVNASNVQMDMTLFNDIYDDISWDAVWSSAAKITDKGWIAEVRIPYSQLRFRAKEEHTWGINVSRWNARLRESSRLVHTPKSESAFVSHFADLTGIRGIAPRRGFEIVPYAVARTDVRSRIDNPFLGATDHRMDGGVDVKYGLTSSLTLTGTVNPDFGQVEVDPAVLNLSQFETFFPEKRPFFTEGADVFRFGDGPATSRFGFQMYYPTFFYSRRIGRSPQGWVDPEYVDPEHGTFDRIEAVDAPRETTILGAAKISGKVGNGWTIGVLDALTDREEARFRAGNGTSTFIGKQIVEPMTNYFVGRATKDYGRDSRVGLMLTSTNRALSGNLDPKLRENALFAGIDGHTLFGDKEWLLEWLGGSSLVEGSAEAIAATQTNGARYYQRPDAGHIELDPSRTSLSGWSGRAMFGRQKGKWRPNIQVQMLSPGFEINDVGYLPRTDNIATHGVLHYRDTDLTKYTREVSSWAAKYQNWNFDGDLIANGVHSVSYVQFRNYWSVSAWGGGQAQRLDDRVTRGGPAVLYPSYRYIGGEVASDARRPFSFELWGEYSARNPGMTQAAGATVNWRPNPAVRLSLTPRYTRITDARQYVSRIEDASYTPTYGSRYVFASIDQRMLDLGLRTDWTINARASLQLFLQPYVASGDYSGFKYLTRPRTGEFTPIESLVYDADSNHYSGGGAAVSSFRNPDFNLRSMRGSAVVRWEFRPGSAMYMVWNENRSDIATVGDMRLGRDFAALPDAPSEDVFLLKFSYWLPV